MLALLVLASLFGCGSDEGPVVPVAIANDAPAVPPAEMRMMLEGLRSDHPRVQYAALENLSRFPSVVQAYREHVGRLKKEGKDQRVRQKAAELLASLEE